MIAVIILGNVCIATSVEVPFKCVGDRSEERSFRDTPTKWTHKISKFLYFKSVNILD